MIRNLLPFVCYLTMLFSASAQQFKGFSTVSSSHNMTVEVTIDVSNNEVLLVLTGPSNQWFGYGFGKSNMFRAYAIITSGAGIIEERKLGNHNKGGALAPSITWSKSTVSGSIRTDSIKRLLAGLSSDHFSFPTSASSFSVIWATGSGQNLAKHNLSNRGLVNFQLSEDIHLGEQNIPVWKLGPNPVNDMLSVRFSAYSQQTVLDIFSHNGQHISQHYLGNGTEFDFSVAHLPKGTYFIRLSNSKGVDFQNLVK